MRWLVLFGFLSFGGAWFGRAWFNSIYRLGEDVVGGMGWKDKEGIEVCEKCIRGV